MNHRNTIQRSLVFEAVCHLHRHVIADEVYEEVTKLHPHISKATVYRNLNQLVECGKILKIEVPNGADRFECMTHNHYHAKCLKCGRIFDVDMEYIPDLEKNIKNTYNFEFSGHDIMFKGTCPHCLSVPTPNIVSEERADPLSHPVQPNLPDNSGN